MYSIYEVETNDTLSSVANKVGISIDELASINGIMAGTILTPGQLIIVPNKTNENEYFKRYKIRPNDTIYSIAKANNLNPSDLLRLNGLNENDIIYENDTIFIPREGVIFYITKQDDTLKKVSEKMNVRPNDLSKQNDIIYLTNDQLIVYKK
ncbi:MAG: LysM peptidoglycan-binding domain-containing protein [Bacilli bacterium]|nr:LysM peptidoglycan-binding domain-containing protein [Bacilli bacterium]